VANAVAQCHQQRVLGLFGRLGRFGVGGQHRVIGSLIHEVLSLSSDGGISGVSPLHALYCLTPGWWVLMVRTQARYCTPAIAASKFVPTNHEAPMSKQAFHQLVADVATQIAGRPLDADLDRWLNTHHGAGSPTYEALKQACIGGVAEGW